MEDENMNNRNDIILLILAVVLAYMFLKRYLLWLIR